MPYKIQELDAELYKKLARTWMINSINMIDAIRDVDTLDMMLESPTCCFYETKNPDVFFWLSSVQPGHQAEFHVLNARGRDSASNIGQYFPTIREIFTDFNLHRVLIAVPSVRPKLEEYAKKLFFKYEGTLRKGAIVDGKFSNLTLLGLVKEDIPEKEQKR